MKPQLKSKAHLIRQLSCYGIALYSVLFLPQPATGQPENPQKPELPDSISTQLKRQPATSDKTHFLFQQIEQYQYRQPELALQLAEKAIELAPASALGHYWQAWLQYYESNSPSLDMANTNAHISAELFSQENDNYGLARSYGLLAAIFLRQADKEQARTNTEKAEETCKLIHNRTKDSLWVSAYINTLRASQPKPGDSTQTRMELEQALEKYRLLQYEAGIGRTCRNLAQYYWENKVSETAVTAYFREALTHFEACGSKSGLSSTLVRFGAYYTDLYTKDINRDTCFERAIECLRKAGDATDNFETAAQLAVTYHHKAAVLPPASAGFNDNLAAASLYYETAIALARQSGSLEDLDILVQNISLLCGKTGDCALWMQKISKASKVIALEKRNEAKKAQDMLSGFVREQSRLRQRNQWITASLMMLGLVAVFIFIFFQLRVRSLNRELQAQLKMLQARLNPHFIANCMNAIDSLINHGRTKEASNYIIKFTRLCRNLLDNSDETTVSVAREVETLKYYLDLEKLRLGDKLNYEIHVDETINQKAVKIPLMLIQPFVENSIWHGIQLKETPGTVKIGIQMPAVRRLRLTVEDDGIGREKSKKIQSASNREHRSWGMDISRQRIEAIRRMKGASYEIKDLANPQGEAAGTHVSILLPL